MFFLPRTDLALEDLEREKKEIEQYEIKGVSVQKITLDKESAKKYKKKEGMYYTITTDAIVNFEHDECGKISEAIKDILEDIYLGYNLNLDSNILVCGLGNELVTPDSLGPKVIKKIFVTKHLADLGTLEKDLGVVGALAPGVMGQTGIETSDIIGGIVKKIKPDLVIVVDALASRSLERINRTIQITTAGINPGSGVGNKRKEISQKTLGIPVIAIGVPTVVDVVSVFYDTLKMLKEDIDEFKEYDVRDVLDESNLNYMVTPKEIDEVIIMLSDTISKGINTSIHNLEVYE